MDLVDEDNDYYYQKDAHGHGTHVAGKCKCTGTSTAMATLQLPPSPLSLPFSHTIYAHACTQTYYIQPPHAGIIASDTYGIARKATVIALKAFRARLTDAKYVLFNY